ncbi:hypothetical protein HJFPF1_04489 [Paramyrothecium foliicola]|nr:hypothetical protein HJFPF1_04489 [Paramyrothecium foliicola]
MQLGSLIVDPLKPTKPLSGRPSQLAIETVIQTSHTLSRSSGSSTSTGISANLLSLIGTNVGTSKGGGTTHSFAVEVLETRYLRDEPQDDDSDLLARLQEPRNDVRTFTVQVPAYTNDHGHDPIQLPHSINPNACKSFLCSTCRNEQASLPCPAWIFSNNSNVHVAKDRSWFGDDYIPFQSSITHAFLGGTVQVVGVGTVNLPTKVSLKKTGPRSHATVCLKQVLHVPTVICNIIGNPIMDDHNVTMGGDDGHIYNIAQNRPVAFFKPGARFFEVRLSGPPVGPKVGPSPFDESMNYMINATWPDSERDRFAALGGMSSSGALPAPALTEMEKSWLKAHFESEFKFLQAHGLNIYKEEDRDEGRTILRTIMSADEDELSSEDEFEMMSPGVGLANAYFSNSELKWINSSYGNSVNFMLSFGLKVYKDDDCREAQAIARAMMNKGDDDECMEDNESHEDGDDSDVSSTTGAAAKSFLLSQMAGSGVPYEDGEKAKEILQSRRAPRDSRNA